MSYATSRAHLLDELGRIDAMLDGCDLQAVAFDGTASPDDVSAADAETLPHRPEELPLALPAESREEIVKQTEQIAERCRQTEAVRLRLRVLAETCDLSRRHLDVLVLALAPRLDEHYHTVFQRLHNRDSLTFPTEILLETLFATTPQQRLAAGALVGSTSPLRRHDLIELQASPDPEFGDRGRLITVSDRTVEYLKGYDGVDPDLDAALADYTPDHGGGVVEHTADASLDDLAVEDATCDRLAGLADPDHGDTGGRRCYWYGPASEKSHAVAAVCPTDRYLEADLGAVLEADALDWLRREAALLGRPLHLTRATAATDHPERSTTLDAVFDALTDLKTDVFVTGSDSWTPTETIPDGIDAVIEFPYPSADLRRAFWRDHAKTLPESVDPDTLAGTFRLTHGQLRAALSTARSLADGDELTAEAIYRGCTAQSTDELGELAHRIEPDSEWDEVQLRPDTERELRLVRTHIARQATIYGDWGFAEAFSRGTGVVALFEGPSGTGKTMAAEILAGDVGMDLYRIDLSSVVSKYIGETEEKLEAIFEAATNANAILLFDEADAVFGDRTEVSDSTDRYANAEVNYLLQRIESYDGVVLLTTNYASAIDSAFQRRLDHTVSFKQPQQPTRSSIWREIFPDDAPLGEIDYAFLSSFEFTGGRIKQVAQTAAILAAEESASRIEMRHLVRAIQSAFETSGRMVAPEAYEPYHDLLCDPQADAETSPNAADLPDTSAHATDDPGPTDGSENTDPDSLSQPTADTPEGVVRTFVERLGNGDPAIYELYHSRAVAEEVSKKDLRRAMAVSGSISGAIKRVQDESDQVVLEFVHERDGTAVEMAAELRPEDGEWRLFDLKRGSAATSYDSHAATDG